VSGCDLGRRGVHLVDVGGFTAALRVTRVRSAHGLVGLEATTDGTNVEHRILDKQVVGTGRVAHSCVVSPSSTIPIGLFLVSKFDFPEPTHRPVGGVQRAAFKVVGKDEAVSGKGGLHVIVRVICINRRQKGDGGREKQCFEHLFLLGEETKDTKETKGEEMEIRKTGC